MVFKPQSPEEHTARNIKGKSILKQLIKTVATKNNKSCVAACGSVNCYNISGNLGILNGI
jgi:hypothetical protein